MTNEPHDPHEQSLVPELLQAWQALGEELFADGEVITVPKLAIIRDKVTLFAIDLALTKHDGNITRAAHDLRTSRRQIRDKLKAASRYPWQPLRSLEFTVT